MMKEKDVIKAREILNNSGGIPRYAQLSIDAFMKLTGYTVEDIQKGDIWSEKVYPAVDEDGYIEYIILDNSENHDEKK